MNKQILGAALVVMPMIASSPRVAFAADEIQVYNAEIAEVGQWTVQQHFNYVLKGRTELEFPGGLVPNHSLNGTPEWAYGLTDWWEVGFYAPFAIDSGGRFLSNGVKLRSSSCPHMRHSALCSTA